MNGDDFTSGRAKGGFARAKALSPGERRAIASAAARARWDTDATEPPILRATHGSADHPLRIGDIEIPCYVLEDGTRVLSQRGVVGGLDMKYGPRVGGADRLTSFLVGKSISPFVSNDLLMLLGNPIKFKTPHGGKLAWGYPATILADICDAVLAARQSSALQKQQQHIADRCEILVRGFARVGIIALVDEATGYQDERVKTALQDVFNAFLRRELAAWVQRFPEEFYREIYRLRGWDWKGMRVNRPHVVAYYTVDIVYSRLLPHIMEELENRMPRTETGRRKGKLHQLFSDDIGHPALAQHLYAVITLMRVAEDGDWDGFMRMLNRAHPKKTEKWLRLLLQETEAVSRPEPIKESTEPLPLFARLRSAASD
jgi:P63C domain